MYVDPNAPVPDVQSTRPSSAIPLGEVGSTLNDLVEAANSGELEVDEATGAATVRAIDTIRAELDQLLRLATVSTSSGGTRLGGGYAELIDRFNREWSVDGAGSATEVMNRFAEQLDQLKVAVQKSMATYQTSDESGARRIDQVEGAP